MRRIPVEKYFIIHPLCSDDDMQEFWNVAENSKTVLFGVVHFS